MAEAALPIADARRPRVTVAIPSLNGRYLLEMMLPSLATQSYRDFAVLVVDDASGDDTAVWLRAHWSGLRVHALSENVGVSAAFNVCVRETDSELLMLLNNDVELERGCLAALVQALDEHPEAGSAAPKLLRYHDRDVLDGAGDALTWAGRPVRRGNGEPDRGQYDAPGEILGACGGAALYRRTALEQVGPFDAEFFAYCEDADWSLRAQLLDLRCRYVPTAIAYHMGSATLGRQSDFTLYHLWRNEIWLVAKDLPARALLRHGHHLLRGQLSNLGMAVSCRRVGLWARAVCDALRGLPAMLRKRRALQRGRRISSGELERRVASAAGIKASATS